MPILHAPILEQAGFSVGSVEPEPVINYAARLDGVSQYWQLSEPINIGSNSLVKIKFLGGIPSNRYSRFLAASSGYVGVGNDATIFDTGGVDSSKTKINGGTINKGVTVVPNSGENQLDMGIYGSSTISTIAASSGGSNLMNLPVYMFEVWEDGVLTHQIPLTNKEQGATQIATVGSVNATMINYTEDVWEEI